MRNLVVQLHAGEYRPVVEHLQSLGFDRLDLDTAGFRFMSKWKLLWLYVRAGFRLLFRYRSLRQVDTLVAFGHFAFVLKLLSRLRVIRYRRLFCFAFLLHQPRWFPVFRIMARLDQKNDHYLVFSRFDIDLYAEGLGIERWRLHFLPLCELWAQGQQPNGRDVSPPSGDYYFAGGWSNRDYSVLVETFRSIPARLIIICSPLNWREMKKLSLSRNVEILCDVPPEVFESHVRGAKAGINPLETRHRGIGAECGAGSNKKPEMCDRQRRRSVTGLHRRRRVRVLGSRHGDRAPENHRQN
jgi:hypothetical protein